MKIATLEIRAKK